MYDRIEDEYHLHNIDLKNCSAETFNRSSVAQCNEFVFNTKEVNILNEVRFDFYKKKYFSTHSSLTHLNFDFLTVLMSSRIDSLVQFDM